MTETEIIDYYLMWIIELDRINCPFSQDWFNQLSEKLENIFPVIFVYVPQQVET